MEKKDKVENKYQKDKATIERKWIIHTVAPNNNRRKSCLELFEALYH